MKKENIPNALTLIRIVFIPIFILMLIFGKGYGWHVAAAIVFAVASITDYLDGYLERIKWQLHGTKWPILWSLPVVPFLFKR